LRAAQRFLQIPGPVEQQQRHMRHTVLRGKAGALGRADIGDEVKHLLPLAHPAQRLARLCLKRVADRALRIVDLHDGGNALPDPVQIMLGLHRLHMAHPPKPGPAKDQNPGRAISRP
jgi:hypothetical protein